MKLCKRFGSNLEKIGWLFTDGTEAQTLSFTFEMVILREIPQYNEIGDIDTPFYIA